MPRTQARNFLPSIGRLAPPGTTSDYSIRENVLFDIAEGCHLYIAFTITISIFDT
jgi:hypothetical protein